MATIQLEEGYPGIVEASIRITPNGSNRACKEDIDKIRKFIKSIGPGSEMVISSSTEFVLPGDVFSDCNCQKLEFFNVILSKKTINSISSTVECFKTNYIDQPFLHLLKSSTLIKPADNDFTVPPSVKKLELCSRKPNLIIYCHDNLKELIISKGTAILVKCNNLKKLTVGHTNCYIRGSFTEYLEHFEIDNFFSSIESLDKMAQYIQSFKNLQTYSGLMQVKIVKSLNVKRLQSDGTAFGLSIDDIPDSVEDINFEIQGINSSDILDKKSNIKRICYSETTMTTTELVQKYPNVYFYIREFYPSKDLDVLKNHNKKLSSLIELCNEKYDHNE